MFESGLLGLDYAQGRVFVSRNLTSQTKNLHAWQIWNGYCPMYDPDLTCVKNRHNSMPVLSLFLVTF